MHLTAVGEEGGVDLLVLLEAAAGEGGVRGTARRACRWDLLYLQALAPPVLVLRRVTGMIEDRVEGIRAVLARSRRVLRRLPRGLSPDYPALTSTRLRVEEEEHPSRSRTLRKVRSLSRTRLRHRLRPHVEAIGNGGPQRLVIRADHLIAIGRGTEIEIGMGRVGREP